MLRGERRPGQALCREAEDRLLQAIRVGSSPALEPLFIVSIDSGLRASEIRNLRRGDVRLTSSGKGFEGEIVVRRSKTEAGTGRVVPLTRRASGALAAWLASLPEAGPDAYVFPRHQVGFGPCGRGSVLCAIDFTRPMRGWKSAWSRARRIAGVSARWHDLRHTLVSGLAENPAISEETIRALAGHVSPQMLSRYAHIRAQAKRAAIASLESAIEGANDSIEMAQNPIVEAKNANPGSESPQKSPQSAIKRVGRRSVGSEKSLH